MEKVRTIFMGTPDFSIKALEELIKISNVVAVVTKPDALVGRKKVLTPSSVKELAIKNNIDVLTPTKLSQEYESILKYDPELIVTCAYGKIVPKIILDYPKYGCINIHASLLPKYRGSAPIQWALINGEEETGITLMYMDEGMDTGDIIDTVKYKINSSDNVETLFNKLSVLGSELLVKNFDNIVSGNITRIKQNDNEATMAPMITRDMELLSFNELGNNIINKIRAFSPIPLARIIVLEEEIKVVSAHFVNKDNTTVGKVIMTCNEFGIECIDGIIYFDQIKPVGKNIMDVKSYLNGKKSRG